MVNYIVENHWGDVASVLGILVSLAGFTVTILAALRSQSAALLAQTAAEEARDNLSRFDAVARISAAISSMHEIKRLHRVEAWQILPDRYAAVRHELVQIRSASSNLKADHRSALHGAIQQFAEMERVMERGLANDASPFPRPDRVNSIVSDQIDKLSEILDQLRSSTGTRNNG